MKVELPEPSLSFRPNRTHFPDAMRDTVREEQHHTCAYCLAQNDYLSVHHIIPRKMGGTHERENLVGLCREPCHTYFDEKYFVEGKDFHEVMMEEGKEYYLPLVLEAA